MTAMNTKALRKAAVLMASLDPHMADGLMRQMEPVDAERLRQAVTELGPIDPSEQQAVIDEFFQNGPQRPASASAGVELDPGLQARLMESSPLEEAPAERPRDRSGDERNAPSFRQLAEAGVAELARALADEHPQTIAVVAAHLGSAQAAGLLSELSPTLQAEVISRLVELDQTSPDILREVERGLESRVSELVHYERRREAGFAAVLNILEASSPSVEKTLLANLARYDRGLADRLSWQPLEYEDLAQLDDRELLTLLESADPDVAVLALAGSDPEFVDRVMRQFPARDAHRLRRTMETMGPLPLSDVEIAQSELVELARELDRRQVLTLPRRQRPRVAVAA